MKATGSGMEDPVCPGQTGNPVSVFMCYVGITSRLRGPSVSLITGNRIHRVGYPNVLPIVMLVLICKATEVCLIFVNIKVQSKLHNYRCWKRDLWAKCIALQIKTSLTMGNGIGYPTVCVWILQNKSIVWSHLILRPIEPIQSDVSSVGNLICHKQNDTNGICGSPPGGKDGWHTELHC